MTDDRLDVADEEVHQSMRLPGTRSRGGTHKSVPRVDRVGATATAGAVVLMAARTLDARGGGRAEPVVLGAGCAVGWTGRAAGEGAVAMLTGPASPVGARASCRRSMGSAESTGLTRSIRRRAVVTAGTRRMLSQSAAVTAGVGGGSNVQTSDGRSGRTRGCRGERPSQAVTGMPGAERGRRASGQSSRCSRTAHGGRTDPMLGESASNPAISRASGERSCRQDDGDGGATGIAG
jgi:hypothetical protein